MIENIKKYSLYIIVVLFVLLCMQTCRSCVSRSSQEFIELEQEMKIDSIDKLYKDACDSIVVLNHNIDKLVTEVNHLKTIINKTEKDAEFIKNQNKTLNENLKISLYKDEKSE